MGAIKQKLLSRLSVPAVITTIGAGVTLFLPLAENANDSYHRKIVTAKDALFQGAVKYDKLANLKAGETRNFTVAITGRQLNYQNPKTGNRNHKHVPVGALLGVKLHCAGADVKCTGGSSTRKPVLRRTDASSWVWSIETPKEGKIALTLTVTAYLEDTNKVIEERTPFRQEIKVEDDKSLGEWLSATWVQILAFLSAIGGVGAIVLLWQSRRTSQGQADAESEVNSLPGEEM